jgi:two-component system, NtrC family, sensor kinase
MLNDRSIAPRSPNTDNNPILENSSNPFQRWFKQIAIGHKIGMGYALSIGIVVIGTTTGNLFSTHFWEANQIRLQAEIFQDRAIYASLFLSAAIAVAFGWYTSQAIARPLKRLTEISQEATQTSNFNLQMPVSSFDEVGKLATSLNHLIRCVNELLEEQQEAKEQLEDRVEQRTAQLQHRAQELEETLQELKQTQLQMIQSEKMSSLGQLVAGVTIEINGPIGFIHGNLVHAQEYTRDLLRLIKLYQRYFPNPPELLQVVIDAIDLDFLLEDFEKLLKSMRIGTERVREIVISLRNFSRLDEADFKEANLHEGLDSTLMILHNRLKAQSNLSEIKVIKEYGELPMLECRPGQLNQVFMNILSNAIDALEESNRRNLDATQTALIAIKTALIEEWIVIRIADNGSGMSEAVRSNLFDPFFTTKPVGKGTGLGLSISYQIIVVSHNGKLSCHSEPGQGTEFIIEIPVRQAVS